MEFMSTSCEFALREIVQNNFENRCEHTLQMASKAESISIL